MVKFPLSVQRTVSLEDAIGFLEKEVPELTVKYSFGGKIYGLYCRAPSSVYQNTFKARIGLVDCTVCDYQHLATVTEPVMPDGWEKILRYVGKVRHKHLI